MDPLQSVGSEADAEREPAKPSYYRGFFDAEKRRKVVNTDPTLGQVIVGSVLSVLPIALIAYFLLRRRGAAAAAGGGAKGKQGGFLSELQSSMKSMMDPLGNKDFKVTVKGTSFNDVVGVPEAKEEVRQYVEFLRTPNKFTRLGARLPKGCLLTGKPGTGKTLLAKAVAGEADVPFFSCSGADFIEVYAGSGPKRVRDLFASAKAEAPSVIFIDEIDAVGSRSGGNGPMGLSGEENRTVNQLLAELDGLQPQEAVIVFAATNFAESLDKALLREGRFDRKVELPMPDQAARQEVFEHYLHKVTCADALALSRRLAQLTPGIAPATIAAIVNEAALSAAIAGANTITAKDLLPAVDDVLVGKKHRNRMSPEALRRVALHESGHTLVAWLLPEQSAVIKVSITPRGPAAGFTQQVGREVLEMPTELSLFTDICVMLGGRAAEMTQHTTLTAGAQDDYQRATQTAIQEFLSFGMSRENVGLLAFEPQRLQEGRLYQRHSEHAQSLAEEEAARLLAAASEFVAELLAAHEPTLRTLAATLYEKKELLHEDLERIIGSRETTMEAITSAAREAIGRFTAASEAAALERRLARETFLADTNDSSSSDTANMAT